MPCDIGRSLIFGKTMANARLAATADEKTANACVSSTHLTSKSRVLKKTYDVKRIEPKKIGFTQPLLWRRQCLEFLGQKESRKLRERVAYHCR